MTGDRPTTPGWHCHRCRSTSCRQRADSDTDHVGRVEYRPLLLTQPSSVSWLWSHTHWCPSQRPQEVMRVDGSANPTMPKDPAQYEVGGGQRPNLKSEDSGLRHRFSEAKVSLWMCENGAGHEEARGPTRRRLCCTPFQIFSQRERDVKSATVG